MANIARQRLPNNCYSAKMFDFVQARVEKAFKRKFSDQFNIHRTRANFPNNGMDNVTQMAERGVAIIDRVVVEQMGGRINQENNTWIIPKTNNEAIAPSN